MKNFSTMILIIFSIIFWIFRVIVAFTYQLNIGFAGIIPANETVEIALLFITLLSILLIVKRKIIGGLIYLVSHGLYFGTSLVLGLQILINDGKGMVMSGALNTFAAAIGLLLPLLILGDLMLDRSRMDNPKNKQTDWFYKNQQFDRKKDDRDDNNNYRTM